MLPKKIKSIDFDGNEREETYYFNITEAEMADMALSKDGGLEVYINRIIEAKSVPELKELFKFFIDKSYGVKSDDGKYHRKSPELLADFKATQAYSELIMELLSDTNKAIAFINGIIPTKMRETAKTVDPNHPALK